MLELESRGCARTVRWAAARPGNDTRRIAQYRFFGTRKKPVSPISAQRLRRSTQRDGFEGFVTAVTRGEAYKILEIF